MRKILVPTDFTANASRALDFAVQIAKKVKAEIILLHTCCGLIENTSKDNRIMYNEYNHAFIEQANEKLSSLKEQIEETEKLFVKTKLYKGPVTDTILQASEEHHADLIVLGILHETGLTEKIFGSKATAIMDRTNVPVIFVHPLKEWNIPRKIFIAVNHFEELPVVNNLVFKLAELFNTTVHIAIFTDTDYEIRYEYLRNERNISLYKEKLENRYRNISIKTTLLYGQSFQDTIAEYIREHRIDLVAMITHKQTFTESIFNRCAVKKMYYQTQIPLMVIPMQTNYSLSNEISKNENKYSNAWL